MLKRLKNKKNSVNKIEEFLADKPYEKELVDGIIKNLKSLSGQ